jgi:hypothetical protein
VVIDQINIGGVPVLEREHQTPIARYRNRPLSFAFAFQWMELIGRLMYAGFGSVERDQQDTEPGRVPWVDSSSIAVFLQQACRVSGASPHPHVELPTYRMAFIREQSFRLGIGAGDF